MVAGNGELWVWVVPWVEKDGETVGERERDKGRVRNNNKNEEKY